MKNIQKCGDGLYTADFQLDLFKLKESTTELEKIVDACFKGATYYGPSAASTKSFMEYNVLAYPFPQFHALYRSIVGMFRHCHEDAIGPIPDEFSIQCWLNCYKKGEFIDWHSHWPSEAGAWHGFFCVDTEPDSYTTYRWKNGKQAGTEVKIDSRDNMMVMGLANGDEHRSSIWEHDRPRITIAFDIVPAKYIHAEPYVKYSSYLRGMQQCPMYVNHWLPV